MTEVSDLPDLTAFSGTGTYYRHPLAGGVLYTDGVQCLAESRGAYWLLDKVAILGAKRGGHAKLRGEDWQAWKMTVKNGVGTIRVDDGNGRLLYSERVSWTDYPEPEAVIWLLDTGDGNRVAMLPSEY